MPESSVDTPKVIMNSRVVQSKHLAYLSERITALLSQKLACYLLAGYVFHPATIEGSKIYTGMIFYFRYYFSATIILIAWRSLSKARNRGSVGIKDKTIMHYQILFCIHHQMIQFLAVVYNSHKVS